MPLAKDLSGLPTVSPHGEPPVKNPTIGPLLAEQWAAQFVDTEAHPVDLPMSHEGARVRFSWAGSCGRQISYRMTEAEPSEPLTPADHWRFGLGHLVHDQMQAVVEAAFPGAQSEVKTKLEGGLLAGHCDIEVAEENRRISIELKTINGFGFKKAIGARGPAEGPRTSAKIQAALNALASDADEVVIVYLSLENLSPREAHNLGTDEIGRFCAEWHYTREEFEPWAELERERFLDIIAHVDAGGLAPAYVPVEMPPDALIIDPVKGMWQLRDGAWNDGKVIDAGSWWGCSYCGFQSKCIEDMKAQ